MAWGTPSAATALTLTGSYQTVQESAADKTWSLNPGETLLLTFDVDFQTTPTEDADIIIRAGSDTADMDSDGEAERIIISVANRESDDPAKRTISIGGVKEVQIAARVRDTDDTAGGDDTTTTLTVHYVLDGVSL